MKKFILLSAVAVALVFSACGHKTAEVNEEADSIVVEEVVLAPGDETQNDSTACTEDSVAEGTATENVAQN